MNSQLLAKLIDAKHTVLTQLLELARRQYALAEKGDAAGLIGMLAAKQQLLDALSGIEKQLDPFRQQEPSQRQWPSPEERQRCADTAAGCRQLLNEVMQLDQRGLQVLRQRQQATRGTIDAAGEAARARNAYRDASPPERQQIDLSSET